MGQHNRRPYKLPQKLYCNAAKLNADGVPSMDLVRRFIRLHEEQTHARYSYLSAMYEGLHDIYHDPAKEEWKPDNRIAVNFPKYLVDTFMGYAYGTPIKETAADETINDEVQDFRRNNSEEDEIFELLKMVCEYGHAWEYVYQSEEAETRIKAMAPDFLFCVYDDTIRERALFAIRYGYHVREDGQLTQVKYGEIMTPLYLISFDDGKITETRENPYGMIPVVEYVLNAERSSLYEGQTGMTEIYNRTLSEKGNDVDSFAEAYLEILGVPVDEDGVRRIRDDRIINAYGTDDAKQVLVNFLQKPTADGTQENLLDRLEKLIFLTSMVANISDETFGNSTSGIALSYKLWSTSNLAKTLDRKTSKSLRKRYKLWASLPTNTADPNAYKDITFVFSRNVPKNTQEEAQTAASLSGIVSHKTQLSMLSAVPDADAELERIEEEKQAEYISAGANV